MDGLKETWQYFTKEAPLSVKVPTITGFLSVLTGATLPLVDKLLPASDTLQAMGGALASKLPAVGALVSKASSLLTPEITITDGFVLGGSLLVMAGAIVDEIRHDRQKREHTASQHDNLVLE